MTKCKIINLTSKVPGKTYFSYSWKNVVARPANKEFFIKDEDVLAGLPVPCSWGSSTLPYAKTKSFRIA